MGAVNRTTLLCDSSEQDNLSCGNMGAAKVLQELFPEPGRLQFIYADLGDAVAVSLMLSFSSYCY